MASTSAGTSVSATSAKSVVKLTPAHLGQLHPERQILAPVQAGQLHPRVAPDLWATTPEV